MPYVIKLKTGEEMECEMIVAGMKNVVVMPDENDFDNRVIYPISNIESITVKEN